MAPRKPLLSYLEINGRKIETTDDLKAVFDVATFIPRRKKITTWLKNNCPGISKKLSSCEGDDDAWVKSLARFLGCTISPKQPTSPPVPPECQDKKKTDKPVAPQAKQIPKVSSQKELHTALVEQDCDEILVVGYLAEQITKLLSRSIDSLGKEIIRKCDAYLESPETEEESLKQVLASLGLTGSSLNDKAYFGIFYEDLGDGAKAERILSKTLGLHSDNSDDYWLSRSYLKLLDFEVTSSKVVRGKEVISLARIADGSIKRYANILKKCCLTCDKSVIQREIEVNDLGTCIAYRGQGFCRHCNGRPDPNHSLYYAYKGRNNKTCSDYEIWSDLKHRIKEVESKY